MSGGRADTRLGDMIPRVQFQRCSACSRRRASARSSMTSAAPARPAATTRRTTTCWPTMRWLRCAKRGASPAPRLGRIGYHGGSQGGWVVPLAANSAPVDFVIVGFGLAVNVMDEDQESVALDMHFHHHSADGHGEGAGTGARGRACGRDRRQGGLRGVRCAARGSTSPSPGTRTCTAIFCSFVLPLDKAQMRRMAGKSDLPHTPFHYDPMPALRARPRRSSGFWARTIWMRRAPKPLTHQIADRGRQGLHAGGLSRRRARHDGI